MKISSNFVKKFASAFFAITLAVGVSTAAHAQILLTVEITGDTVTINAAPGAFPSASAGSYSAYVGLDLENFFTGQAMGINPTFSASGTNTLASTAGSSAPVFDTAGPDNVSTDYLDLAVFNGDPSTSSTLAFTSAGPSQSAVQAFLTTGTISFVMPGTSLPGVNTTGTLLAGSSASGAGTAVEIGQWEVVSPAGVPEPSTWLLLIGSLALLPWLRRFRRV